MLHFSFRVQLENQSSALNPAQKAVATGLSGVSDEKEIMEDLKSKQDNSHAGRIAHTPCWVRVQWYVQLIMPRIQNLNGNT